MASIIRTSALSLALLTAPLMVVSCKKGAPPAGGATESTLPPPAVEEQFGVCILDGLAVRESPNKAGKFTSTLQLGEKVKLDGATMTDDTGKLFLKVVLSDGKSGWALAFGLVPNGTAGATKEEVAIYKRPDLLTQTTQRIPFMSVVAIAEEKGPWVLVCTENRKLSGWVMKQVLTVANEDVAVAALATKKLRENDGLDEPKKIEAILSSTPFPDSFFIQKLRERMTAAAEPPANPQ